MSGTKRNVGSLYTCTMATIVDDSAHTLFRKGI
jgi:hypothetical protein